MSWLAVYRKECLDAVRDRRSIAAAVLTMVAGPLLVVLVLTGITRDPGAPASIPVTIEGQERAPSLVAWLRANEVVDPAGAAAADPVRLIVEEGYAADFAAGRPARLTIELDSSVADAKRDAGRLRALLERFGTQVAAVRLLARGVDPGVVSPLDLDTRDRAPIAPLATAALETIPIFLMAAAFVGSMNLAIDATAGERERRSLEQLLLHPVPSWAVATGKWLAAFTAGTISVCGMLLFLRLVFELPAMRQLPIRLDFGWRQVALLALLLVPLAALAAATQLLLALVGKNFKEAQSYLSMVLLAPMVPGFLFAFGAAAPSPWLRALPLSGHHLLASEVLAGGPLSAAQAGELGLVCAAATVALLALLSRQLRREEVLRAG